MNVTFNLERNTQRPYKKPNDNLSYINTSSNHPPQISEHLTETITEKLSSSAETFEQSKPNNEVALKRCVFKAKLQYIQSNLQKNNTRRKKRKIIWFNPSLSLNVKTNLAKMFLQLIDTRFPPPNKLHKISDSNIVKLS